MSSPIVPLTPQQTTKQMNKAAQERYVKRVLIGFDQFVNTVAGGHPDETISARSARAATERKTWGIAMSSFLNLFQKDHGAKAVAGDLQRADTVEYLEQSSGDVNSTKPSE